MALFIDKLTISSPDVPNLGDFPMEFTADGGSSVPRLEFSGAPEGTVEYAIVCQDPDAPLPHGFTHWVVYGISPDATTLDLDSEGLRQGPNGAGDAAYFGPQPPVGHGDHHYYFWIYALDRKVEDRPSREDFLAQYGDNILEQARFVGMWRR